MKEDINVGFIIKCKNCGKEIELKNNFYEDNSDIGISHGYDGGDTWVYCECGNRVDGY